MVVIICLSWRHVNGFAVGKFRHPRDHGRCSLELQPIQLVILDILSRLPLSGVAPELGPPKVSRGEISIHQPCCVVLDLLSSRS